MSISNVSSHTSSSPAQSQIRALPRVAVKSQELGSVGNSTSAGDSVASHLSSSFQSVLLSLGPRGSETSASSTASSNGIQSFINGALKDLQSTGVSTAGNFVNTKA